jgi:hypothetical protein
MIWNTPAQDRLAVELGNGEWVKYSDHVAELASLREAAKEALDWCPRCHGKGTKTVTSMRTGKTTDTPCAVCAELRAALAAGKHNETSTAANAAKE